MFVKLLATSALLITTRAFAQPTIETRLNGDNVFDYVQKHFSASYHGEVYGVRRNAESEIEDEKKVNDLKILHSPTIIYRPADNWQFLSTAEFTFSDQPSEMAGSDYPNGFYRSLFTLTRKNILTKNDHGIQLDAGIGRRQFNTGAKQRPDGAYPLSSYGNNRLFSTLSKTIGKADSALSLQYLHNDYKKSTKTTWKHGIEATPSVNISITERLSYFFNDVINFNTPKLKSTDKDFSITHDMNLAVLSLQLNDQFSTYYQLKYLHFEGFSNKFQSQDDSFYNYMGITLALSQKSSITLELGSELAHARDGRDIFSKKLGLPELALYIDAAI